MGGMTAPLIEARGLAVGYGGKPLISGVNLTLARGETLCLLGPNGAGKTTLFRSLLGLLPAVAGDVLLSGEPLARLTRGRIAERLAYVPQSLATPFAYRALDVALMGASARLGAFARPGRAEEAKARAALEALGVADLAEAPVTELSGGQRQMILIARAVAQEAAAVVMDEPTASLDFANRIRVGQAIRLLARRGVGVILSTHDPDQAAALGDRALLLGKGGVVASGPVAQAMTGEALTRLYGVPIQREFGSDGRPRFFSPPAIEENGAC